MPDATTTMAERRSDPYGNTKNDNGDNVSNCYLQFRYECHADRRDYLKHAHEPNETE